MFGLVANANVLVGQQHCLGQVTTLILGQITLLMFESDQYTV